MATIAQTTISGSNVPVVMTRTTMTSSDTLVYASGTNQVLEINNVTAGSLTVVITGSTATTVAPAGLGATINVSTGFSMTIPAGVQTSVRLDAISAYLSGTITLTGGTGAIASLWK